MRNKKKLFVSLISILTLLSLTITTAFCVWYVSDVKDTTPEYTENIVTQYFDGTSTVFNGNFLLPAPINFAGVENLPTEEFEYYYKGEDDQEYIKCEENVIGPQNAGIYSIMIKYKISYKNEQGETVTEDKESEVTFTIKPIDISAEGAYEAIFQAHPDGKYEYYSCDNKNYTTHNPVVPNDLQVFKTGTTEVLRLTDQYTVEFTNNTGDAGTIAKAVITGVGNYTGVIEKEYKIYKQLYLSGDAVQETIYNGLNQFPVVTVKDEAGNIISSDQYNCSYTQGSTTSTAINVKQNPYDIKVTVTPKAENKDKYEGTSSSYKLSINPKEITLTSFLNEGSAFSFAYTSSINWTDVKSKISSITFSDANFTDYNIYGMCDGTFVYSDSNKAESIKNKMRALGHTTLKDNYTYVAGSTYLVYIEITSDNYAFSGQDYFYLKYKTAKIDSTYYTIEDAIKASGTGKITLPGNLTKEEKSVQITAFSRILETKSYTNSNHNLIVPYTSEGTGETNKEENATTPSSTNTCSCLYIPSGITYTTTKPLYITSSIAGQGSVGDHGVVINDGTMNFNSGSSLTAYGFLKGNGNIVVSSGVTVKDVMCFKDYPGGASATDTLSKSCFPVFAWVLNNISCRTKYKVGSKLECFANIWGSNAGYQKTTITIIGASTSATDCLFVPSSNANSTNDYIEKYTNSSKCNSEFTYDNQLKVASDIDINGSYEDKTLRVEITVMLIYTASFETSYTKPLPIPYININIKRGTLRMSNSSYIFLQGTKLTVDKSANLIVDGQSYIYFDRVGSEALCTFFNNSHALTKTNALLVVNGNLSGTGTVAGIIETNSENAKISINAYSILNSKIAYKTNTAAYTTNPRDVNAVYKKYNVVDNTIDSAYSTIYGGEYTSIMIDDEYGWLANKATISYDTNGGTEYLSKTVDITSQGYTLTASDIPGTPTKPYYNFVNWTLNGVNPVGQVIYGGVVLVANYEPINYSITPHDVNGESVTGESVWNNELNFNIETNIELKDAVRGNLTFGGWYLDSALTNNISRLKGTEVINLLDGNTLHLYASWYPAGTEQYVIYYDNTGNNGSPCIDKKSITVTEGFDWNTVNLETSVTENDNNKDVKTYFGGWYDANGNPVTSISQEMFDENKELTLKAKYVAKNKLNIKDHNGLTLGEVYYKPGYKFTIPDLSNYPSIDLKNNGFVFIRWILTDNSQNEEYYVAGQEITLNNQVTLTPDIRKYVKLSIGANDYTSVTVTLTAGQGYLVTVDQNGNATAKLFDGSTFNAKYTAGSSSKNNSATISGTTDTTALTTSDKSYTVSNNATSVTITPSGEDNSCIIEGTLITMFDGTKRKVEDLRMGDLIRTWSFVKGSFDIKPIIAIEKGTESKYTVITVHLENGYELSIISKQVFFDMDERCYFEISKDNYQEVIGKKVMIEDGEMMKSSVITNVTIEEKVAVAYELITAEDFNFIAEGILTIEPFIFCLNIFEINENYQIDQKLMEEDIEKYGLYTYEEWKDYLTEDEFMMFNGQYFKIAVGKGLTTEEHIIEAINIYRSTYLHTDK